MLSAEVDCESIQVRFWLITEDLRKWVKRQLLVEGSQSVEFVAKPWLDRLISTG